MHRKLDLTKTFRKDLEKLRFTNEHYAKYIVYLGNLLESKPLPPEALDHKLNGEWGDCREFHVSGDLLVIYRQDGDTLQLIRIASHSELFK